MRWSWLNNDSRGRVLSIIAAQSILTLGVLCTSCIVTYPPTLSTIQLSSYGQSGRNKEIFWCLHFFHYRWSWAPFHLLVISFFELPVQTFAHVFSSFLYMFFLFYFQKFFLQSRTWSLLIWKTEQTRTQGNNSMKTKSCTERKFNQTNYITRM